MKSLTYFLAFLFIPIVCFANNQSVQTWINVNHNTRFSTNSDWLYGFLLEGRFNKQPGLFHQAQLQNQAGYAATKTTQLWLGFTIIPNKVVQPTGKNNFFTVRRLYQQINTVLFQNEGYELNSRSRLEERKRTGFEDIGLVYRQLFNLRMSKFTLKNKYMPFISNELFFNVTQPTWSNRKSINQNRLMVGWIFPCGTHKCQLAYLNQLMISQNNKQVNSVLSFNFLL